MRSQNVVLFHDALSQTESILEQVVESSSGAVTEPINPNVDSKHQGLIGFSERKRKIMFT
jgi:hypothetical protein